MKKVSIITPVYNGEEYIERYLISVINQTYKNIELIIVDDGSKDKTREIINKYIDKNKNGIEIKYLYQDNAGQAAAVANAIKNVNGKYLAWADSDDYYELDAIASMVEYLENNPQYAIVRCNAVARQEGDLEKIVSEMNVEEKYRLKTDIFEDCVMIEGINSFIGIYMMRFEKYKEKNPQLFIYPGREGQNWQLLLPVLYRNKCGFLNKTVYNYVVRNNSHSHMKRNVEQIEKRVEGLKNTLFATLDILDLEEDCYNELRNRINKKYTEELFLICAKNFEKERVKTYYKNISKKTAKLRIFYLIGVNRTFNKLYKFLYKIRVGEEFENNN